MTEPHPEVWVLITQDGTVTAYDTQDAAISAAADETDPWIECVQVTSGLQTAEQDENALSHVPIVYGPETGVQRCYRCDEELKLDRMVDYYHAARITARCKDGGHCQPYRSSSTALNVPTGTGMTAYYNPWADGTR